MLNVLVSTLELLFFHILITIVDRVSRLPRHSTPPELMRLCREDIALKSQLRALVLELKAAESNKPTVSVRTRAAQVLAYLLTRNDKAFTGFYLSASERTLRRWTTRFLQRPWPWRRTPCGRPRLAKEIAELIVTFKRENPVWGARRIRDELPRMGIQVSQPTIQKVLRENGFSPKDGHPINWERFTSTGKDILWAADFFAVRTAKGVWLQVLLIIDVYTRELIELRAADVWAPDACWTICAFNHAMRREGRQPAAVMHDRAAQFKGQFERQLRVLGIEQRRIPPRLPVVNGRAERAGKSVRLEPLNHVRPADAEDLQWYLNEYRVYYGEWRPNQALDGRTPKEYADKAPVADIIDIETIRRRRLVRHSFAHGLLNSYELVEEEAA